MSHLAADPGKRAGYAAMPADCVTESGIIRGDSVEEVGAILRKYREMETLVLENTFIATRLDEKGRGRPRNPKGIKTLLYRRHLWEMQAQQLGMRVELVYPSTWQGYFKVKLGDKDAICKMAKILTGREMKLDESDATCMAYWYAAKLHAARIIGGAS